MPIRQYESVPIGPLGVRRIVLHQLVKQQIGHRCAAQRRPRMAALAFSTPSKASSRKVSIESRSSEGDAILEAMIIFGIPFSEVRTHWPNPL